MSEDTSGNPGVTWPQPEAAAEVVRRIQIKLHRWASEDSARRFDDLHNQVVWLAPSVVVARVPSPL